MTRERPILFSTPMVQAILEGRKSQTRRIVKKDLLRPDCVCPYGKPGDRLWVRETWGRGTTPDGFTSTLYKADADLPEIRWRPSIHMPKAAARIWLEVEEVRVQRLQDIGHQDAVDEGILREWDGTKYWYQDYTKGAQGMVTVSQLSYKSLWESINGPDSWEQNPFVWVIKFKKFEP